MCVVAHIKLHRVVVCNEGSVQLEGNAQNIMCAVELSVCVCIKNICSTTWRQLIAHVNCTAFVCRKYRQYNLKAIMQKALRAVTRINCTASVCVKKYRRYNLKAMQKNIICTVVHINCTGSLCVMKGRYNLKAIMQKIFYVRSCPHKLHRVVVCNEGSMQLEGNAQKCTQQ